MMEEASLACTPDISGAILRLEQVSNINMGTYIVGKNILAEQDHFHYQQFCCIDFFMYENKNISRPQMEIFYILQNQVATCTIFNN